MKNLLKKKEVPMGNIGVFGHLIFQDLADKEGDESDRMVAEGTLRSSRAAAAGLKSAVKPSPLQEAEEHEPVEEAHPHRRGATVHAAEGPQQWNGSDQRHPADVYLPGKACA